MKKETEIAIKETAPEDGPPTEMPGFAKLWRDMKKKRRLKKKGIVEKDPREQDFIGPKNDPGKKYSEQ